MEINVDKCGYLKVHDFTDRYPKKCTILPIDSAYHYAKQSAVLLYRRNSVYCGSMAVIRRKQVAVALGMPSVEASGSTAHRGVAAIGTAYVAPIRLPNRAPVPAVSQHERSAGRTPAKLTGCCRCMSNEP
jgi:hypothetical protein